MRDSTESRMACQQANLGLRKSLSGKSRRTQGRCGTLGRERKLYRDKEGNYRFLLDEKMGLDKDGRVSRKMKELAIRDSTHYTFREVEQNIKAIFPWGISHTTCPSPDEGGGMMCLPSLWRIVMV